MRVWITVRGATLRRAAWWFLLTCTVIGLATMHTLGHGSFSSALHATGSSALVTAAKAAAHDGTTAHGPAGHAGQTCDGHECSRSGGGGHDGAVWNVCLAVLAGLTALLPGWLLLLALHGRDSAGLRPPGAGDRASRTSPRSSGVGLRLASVSVMRL